MLPTVFSVTCAARARGARCCTSWRSRSSSARSPNYLKHADKRPHAILKKHSDKHTYITLTLAIRLWKERAQPETTHMQAFSELPDPFKPGHKASETLKFVQHGPIADPRAAQSHLDGY